MRREFLVLVLLAGATSCGLIDAISGGPVCDENGCACPQDTSDVFCLGDACACGEDGTSVCDTPDGVCSVEDDDGCFNAACVCSGDDACDCLAAAGTCSTTNGTIELTGDGSNDSCIGNCACTLDVGCECLDTDCVFGVDGAPCETTDECRVLQMASDTGCASERDCADGQFCGQLPGGETGCFLPNDDCSPSVLVVDVVSGGSAPVCLSPRAAATCDELTGCVGSLD
jgi:hypothetical protein